MLQIRLNNIKLSTQTFPQSLKGQDLEAIECVKSQALMRQEP
jgi:hypothetical protein